MIIIDQVQLANGLIIPAGRGRARNFRQAARCELEEPIPNDQHVKRMVSKGGGDKIYLPMEQCTLQPNQFLRKEQFDLKIEQELLARSTHLPNVYFNKVANIVNTIKQCDTDGVLEQFGIDFVLEPARFQGRVLPAPRTICSRPQDPFYKPAQSTRTDGSGTLQWAIYCFEQRNFTNQDLKNFACRFSQFSNRFGLRLGPPKAMEFVPLVTLDDVERHFRNVHMKANFELDLDFVVVGIPSKPEFVANKDVYGLVKHCCDQTFGFMSQCFNSDKLCNPPNGYFDSLLLKVNGKSGGQNSALHTSELNKLPFNRTRTQLVGIDVNHPGNTERVLSSVSAAVGSYDAEFTKYICSIRVQAKARNEMVLRLDEMIPELLEQYRDKNNYYPENLIVFRDGVSEGQFTMVQDVEIKLIEEAILATIGTMIKLTVIITQKRHSCRFALTEANTSGRRPTFNVPSGTVVDQAIVDPRWKVFYLNSHFSPIGTSKSAKYIIIRDDLHMTTDQVQKLCFYACFNCIRTRNVLSIPVPVRYADLCAYRSKIHIEAQLLREDNGSDSSGRSLELDPIFEARIINDLNDKARIDERLRGRLFYC